LASVSPTVAGSKPKKLLDQTRDVLRLKHYSLRNGTRLTWRDTSSKSARPAKDFESCETVSIAESAQRSLVRCPAQLVSHNQTSRYAKIDIFFPVHGNGDHGWSAVGNKC
jgi:hypothetical protein